MDIGEDKKGGLKDDEIEWLDMEDPCCSWNASYDWILIGRYISGKK